MKKSAIEKFVKEQINQSKVGLQIERPNFDFKTQWPILTDPEKVGSLLKTITAMANTIGPPQMGS